MDAVKYLKELSRMCDTYESCSKCQIGNISLRNTCSENLRKFSEKAVEIVEKWSAEHPQKTILMDFLEKYPNAEFSEGIPKSCCHLLGYPQPNECGFKTCTDCWNRPAER